MSETFDLEAEWQKVFSAEVHAQVTDTQVPPKDWRVAGRVSREKPNKEDGVWWGEAGLGYCANWMRWREESGWRTWGIGDTPAIEIGGLAYIGGWPVKCFIDRVMVTPAGELVILDLKTGARSPDSDLQLGIYACWLQAKYGVRPPYGCYWLARKSEISVPVSLDHYTNELIGSMFTQVGLGIQQQIFVPHVGEHCKRCGVARACYAVNGDEAIHYDPLHPDYQQVQEDG